MEELNECLKILQQKKAELETEIELEKQEVLFLKQLIQKEKENKMILEEDLITLKKNNLSQLSDKKRCELKCFSQKIKEISEKNSEFISYINHLNDEIKNRKEILKEYTRN